MKRFLFAVALVAIFVGTSFAEPQLNRPNVWRAKQTFVYGFDDQILRTLPLPLGSFTILGTPVTASTAPGYEIDDTLANIVWADGETTPIQITFRVPADYDKNGKFKLFVSESNSSTPNQIDYDVYINKADNSTAVDSAATNQTPVAMVGTTPETVTLNPTTELTSLKAGDYLTFRVWRDNVANGTGDLELKDAVFEYE